LFSGHSAYRLSSDPDTEVSVSLTSIAIIAGGLLLFSLVSGRLQGTIITPPLVFMLFGFAIGSDGLGIAKLGPDHATIHLIAEFTLIVVLFSDAARMDLTRLKRDHNLPVRMLLIGLPLAIVFGTLVAILLFPGFSLWETALLAALLAPTDAALGQSVVTARGVPVRIRQAINVESGLNDGIALPAVLMFAALASVHTEAGGASEWLQIGTMQITLGPVAGVVVGYAGARLLDTALLRGWASDAFQGIGILSLALFLYVVAELIGGNGFIAAFVGGIVFGNTLRHPCSFLFEFMETEGNLLMLVTFLIFGAVLLPEGLVHLTPATFFYAILSLTVIRMVPVAIALIGASLRPPTYLFLGWFGPRGLASILFVLLILEESEVVHRNELLAVTVVTVALSTLLHGLSAAPLARRYALRVAAMGECEESQAVSEIPLREGSPGAGVGTTS